jgi:hypothetical protein
MGKGTFLLEIVRRLVYIYGYTEDDAKSRVYGYDIRVKYVGHLTRRGLKNLRHKDFLNEVINMKFDVVVGNYPFQDSNDTGGLLWDKFAKKSCECLKIGGYSCVIHPPSFIGKHLIEKKGKSDYSVFNDKQIIEIHLFDSYEKEKYFKGIGSKICWYVLKNVPPTDRTKIYGYDNNKIFLYEDFFSNLKILPQIINEITLSIHKKIMESEKLKFNFSRKLHYFTMKKKNQVSETQSEDFPYLSFFSHRIARYSNFTFEDYDKIKVMVPQTSTFSKSFIHENCNVSEDLFYHVCQNLEDAEIIVEQLNSNVVEYIGRMYRNGRNLGFVLKSNILPKNIDKLKLTEEEIQYINDYTV